MRHQGGALQCGHRAEQHDAAATAAHEPRPDRVRQPRYETVVTVNWTATLAASAGGGQR